MSSASAAIRLGITQTASRWATALFAALASIAEVLAGTTATFGFLAWVDGSQNSPQVAMGAAVAGVFAARILLWLVHGGAVRQSAAWLRGQHTGTTLEEIFYASPRSLAVFAWSIPLELLTTAWKWLGIAAVVYGYGRALSVGHGGCPAALAFAGYLVAVLPIGLGWAALRRVALVNAVHHDVGAWKAATLGVASLVRRPLAFLGVLLLGLFASAMVDTGLSFLGSALGPAGGAGIEPMVASQLAVGVLLATAAALFDLFLVYAFTALEATDL
jgi:hypothetical protein